MKKRLILLALLLVAACTPAGSLIFETTEPPIQFTTPTPEDTAEPVVPEPTETVMIVNQPVETVRAALAEALSLPLEDIVLVEMSQVTFRDGCLEAPAEDEMCIQVLTPGYRVIFQMPDGEHWYHLNADGSVFREAPQDFPPITNEE